MASIFSSYISASPSDGLFASHRIRFQPPPLSKKDKPSPSKLHLPNHDPISSPPPPLPPPSKMEATRRFLFSRSSAASLRQVRLPSSSTTGTSRSSGANEKRGAAAASASAPPALERKLKPRHVQMMSVAGAFGTGLIISSGTGLMRGGPGSLLIAYVIMGLTVFSVMTALAEMATFATSDRGFPGYATRFADPALG